jgi:hypothetical protein
VRLFLLRYHIHMTRKNHGFSAVEAVVIVLVVAVIGLMGWFVLGRDKKDGTKITTSSQKTTERAIKITEKLADQQAASSPLAGTTDPNAESNTSQQPADSKYSSKYEKYAFSYPSNWETKVWSDDATSSGVTLTSPDGAILLSFGSPVVAPTSKCKSTSPRLMIHRVQKADVSGSARQLYLIEYSLDDLKSVALTDWEGTEPTAGQTDKCGYQPAFKSKNANAHVWFKISDISDQYRGLSASQFFELAEVKAAKEIILSGSYN